MPPSDRALLLVFKTLFLTQESILIVDLALNDNPANALPLMELKADLTTLKDELVALRDQMEDGRVTFPPPDPSVLQHVRGLITQVEAAKNAGVASGAALAAVGDALATGITVMSLVKA